MHKALGGLKDDLCKLRDIMVVGLLTQKAIPKMTGAARTLRYALAILRTARTRFAIASRRLLTQKGNPIRSCPFFDK